MEHADLLIVGAGPAGLAAAIAATELGLATVVVDEQPAPGGQIYRTVEANASVADARRIFGDDYVAGLDLVRRFRACGARYLHSTQVWQIDRELHVWTRGPRGVAMLRAGHVLIATGAIERPVPLPGWTLPGVMTCGAAQTLLKASGVVPDGRVVLAGSGPLLLLMAAQLLRAGVRPERILETPGNLGGALRHLPAFLAAPGYLGRGLAMLRELRRAKLPIQRGVRRLRLLGSTRVEAVQYEQGGRMSTVPADVVLLHQGVVPSTQLGLSMRCEHVWDERQRCFRPRLNDWFASSVPNVSIAGDGSGIIGAVAAECSGRLAALGAAVRLGRLEQARCDELAAPARRMLEQHRAARPFLDAYYAPAREILSPVDGETIVCRCEEVDAASIRRVVQEQGCPGPNQMKAFLRCGMGPCQGRLCGLAVTELIAEERRRAPDEIGYFRIRPPIKPVSLGDLADHRDGDSG